MGKAIGEAIIARLQLEDDGSLSNKRIERYALLRAEEVISITAAWTLIMASKGGNLPTGGYQANVHKSPAFKRRLGALMDEKVELEGKGVWGQLEWQARQIYRKAAALDDIRAMQAATDTLLKVAARGDPPKKPEKDPEEDGEPRGRGAPAIPTPEESNQSSRAARLLER